MEPFDDPARPPSKEETNEAVVEDDGDVEAHGSTLQTNETVVADEPEVEPHNWGGMNVNQATVEDDS